MKFIICISILLYSTQCLFSQKFTLEKSTVSFYSDAPMEAIKAENIKSAGLLNLTTGDIVFSIPIEEFEFEKDLMKKHFNEKYLETEKYPKATFQGKIIGFKTDVSGEQETSAKGKLTMHGVTKEIEVKGTIDLTNNKPRIKANFKIQIADYNIKIPKLLWKNIAEEVDVKVEFNYKP